MPIRDARPEDCPAICALIRELAVYERLEHLMAATSEDLARDLFSPNPVVRSIVAEREAEIIGYAMYFRSYSTFLAKPGIWLEDLYVKNSERGSGIGKALLAHVGRIAKEECAGRLEWSVLDWNEPAIGFYERLGADIMSDWRICRLEEAGIAALSSTAE
ncbi:MAG: GNAT family N-acetyltransferase [Fimbriimonadaceae bacterium]|nr:GNAT family N-acetyltransferase [Fimbriimonadaceae bacterium]